VVASDAKQGVRTTRTRLFFSSSMAWHGIEMGVQGIESDLSIFLSWKGASFGRLLPVYGYEVCIGQGSLYISRTERIDGATYLPR
jgi:hypothetical protein